MIEVDGIVDKLLSPLRNEGITVQFMYQATSAQMPAVTYYINTDSECFRTDNSTDSQLSRVQIDVWTAKRSQMSQIGIKVADIMTADGWLRELTRDLPRDDNTQAYHRTMRFAKEIWGE